jgi:squalene synthase HpnC
MSNDEFNELERYYQESIKFTKSHYENFPVISFFIKKEIRKYISVIYRFARQADDIADEGSAPPEKRISLLDEYEAFLLDAIKSNFKDGFWKVLADTVKTNNLTIDHFRNLLKAFRQDTHKTVYEDYDELLNYCSNSANPVGRIILELHGIREETPNQLSDKICTALQLTNFYQDVSVDIKKGRIYLPAAEMELFNITGYEQKKFLYDDSFVRLMKFQTERVKKLFSDGRQLLKFLPRRLKLQILITIKGGEAIIKKIEEIDYNVLELRPTLSKLDFIKLFIVALLIGK